MTGLGHLRPVGPMGRRPPASAQLALRGRVCRQCSPRSVLTQWHGTEEPDGRGRLLWSYITVAWVPTRHVKGRATARRGSVVAILNATACIRDIGML